MKISPTISTADSADSDWEAVLADPTCMGPASAVAIKSLLQADSPRLAGEDAEHIRRLAEIETELSPILVHSGTLRVIDGMHRLRAAQLNGQDRIQACFFHGDERLIFPLAVKANIQNGLPLTLADREAAAARILADYHAWSDRAIAALVGLSAWTVGMIRGRTPESSSEPPVRVGLDGRVRPLDAKAGRRLACRIIASRPDASLREVAKAAGISPNTVRDVRQRMLRGEEPVPVGPRGHRSRVVPAKRSMDADRPATTGDAVGEDPEAVLARLRRDPSIKLSQTGRDLVRWLGMQAQIMADRQRALGAVPPHQASAVANLATCWAHIWLEFARDLERRSLIADPTT